MTKDKDEQPEMKNIKNKKDDEENRLEELNEEFNDRNMETITEGDEDLDDEEIDNIDLGG